MSENQRVLVGKCRKCGEAVRIVAGDLDKEGVAEQLKKMSTFQCPGHHVELSSPYPNYWNVTGSDWLFETSEVLSEEEFKAKLEESYEVRDTDGMYGLITGFAYGLPITNDGRPWDFTHSPKGKRWYFAPRVG